MNPVYRGSICKLFTYCWHQVWRLKKKKRKKRTTLLSWTNNCFRHSQGKSIIQLVLFPICLPSITPCECGSVSLGSGWLSDDLNIVHGFHNRIVTTATPVWGLTQKLTFVLLKLIQHLVQVEGLGLEVILHGSGNSTLPTGCVNLEGRHACSLTPKVFTFSYHRNKSPHGSYLILHIFINYSFNQF